MLINQTIDKLDAMTAMASALRAPLSTSEPSAPAATAASRRPMAPTGDVDVRRPDHALRFHLGRAFGFFLGCLVASDVLVTLHLIEITPGG